MKLQGKTVLITGASSGIGKDFALKASKDGATIILAARSEDKLIEIATECEKLGGKAVVVPTDVTKIEDIRNLFLKATEGGRVLDVVLSNAGIGYVANIYDLTNDQIESIIDVNVKGMLLVSKFASEIMVRQKYGHLLLTSSLAGLITLPQWSVYVASKWAITSFADCIRSELKPYNVKVTTIHPGAVKTEFFDKDKANIDISNLGDAIEVSEVSDVIYDAIFSDKKRVLVPNMVKNYSLLYRYIPGFVQSMIEKMASKVAYHSDIVEDEPEFSYIHVYNAKD